MNTGTAWQHWLSGLLAGLLWSASAFGAGAVYVLRIDGAIGPASAEYVTQGLAQAERDGAEALVLELDTPGGLDQAMRDIIHAILAANTPVIVYVAPGGARAASAGTYILYASHLAAMAPGTNLGAATPIPIGEPMKLPDPVPDKDKNQDKGTKGTEAGAGADTLSRKIVNDATAFLKSLAQMRGRSVPFAERAVREAASLTAEEALKAGVIELIASDRAALLAEAEGRSVMLASGARPLHTQGTNLVVLEPGWRIRLLMVLTNPSIAYLLLLIGMYGLFFEFYHPGTLVPGVIGAIALLLAGYAFQLLPVSLAGLALLLLGVALMVAEAFLPSFGVAGIGGIAAFLSGSLLLFDRDVPGFRVALPLILAVTAFSALFFSLLLGLAVKARQRPVLAGAEELVGAEAIATEDFVGSGHVRVRGEIWRAYSETDVRTGERVRIAARDGLCLHVKPEA